MDELVSVRARDCACPGSPHAEEGDIVFLRPTLSMNGGLVAERQMKEVTQASDTEEDVPLRISDLEVLWARTFIEDGAVGWNLMEIVDEANLVPRPFDVEAIMADWAFARAVADKAVDLYADAVLDPFLKASRSSSPTGPTGDSTSRRPPRSRRSRGSSSPGTSEGTALSAK